ncbi:hypothetical protein NDU88_005678 [Pleurodeles waltl]|uniref:Uncharacterized protein n=1 Tax=Pleurodeles waltl TaxID=8319 RepID=A0AAV7UJE6_PLEWA|nr:hypothetical protein NDU88_005678 [Pleurodeles waltl]
MGRLVRRSDEAQIGLPSPPQHPLWVRQCTGVPRCTSWLLNVSVGHEVTRARGFRAAPSSLAKSTPTHRAGPFQSLQTRPPAPHRA